MICLCLSCADETVRHCLSLRSHDCVIFSALRSQTSTAGGGTTPLWAGSARSPSSVFRTPTQCTPHAHTHTHTHTRTHTPSLMFFAGRLHRLATALGDSPQWSTWRGSSLGRPCVSTHLCSAFHSRCASGAHNPSCKRKRVHPRLSTRRALSRALFALIALPPQRRVPRLRPVAVRHRWHAPAVRRDRPRHAGGRPPALRLHAGDVGPGVRAKAPRHIAMRACAHVPKCHVTRRFHHRCWLRLSKCTH